MSEIECHNCGNRFEHEATGSYPTGPCPATCPKCKTMVCPLCGGALTSETSHRELLEYCGRGCGSCEWEHCGGCI